QLRESAVYWYLSGLLAFVVLRFAINKLDVRVLKRDAKVFVLPMFLVLVLINDGLSGQNLVKFLGSYAWTPEGIKQKQDILRVGYQALSFVAPRCPEGKCLFLSSKEDYPKWIVYNVTTLDWSDWLPQSIDNSCQLS